MNNSHIGDHTLHGKDFSQYSVLGSRDGVVMIALASHLRGPGSGHEWVKFFVGSLLCSERFLSAFSGFPLSSNINISKFQMEWDWADAHGGLHVSLSVQQAMADW